MTVLEHQCGARLGLRVVIGPTYYVGTWVDLASRVEIERCPGCGRPLRAAYQMHELREMPPEEWPR